MTKKIAAAGWAAFLLVGLALPGVALSADLGDDVVQAGTDLPFTRELSADSIVTGSLADSADAAGVPVSAMAEALRAFATALDLNRDVRIGDRFHVRYEETFSLDDAPTGQARVLWAEIRTAKGTVAIHRFRPRDGVDQFWLGNGRAAAPAAIHMPLDVMTVTSGFGWRTDPLDHPPGPLANMTPPPQPDAPRAPAEPTPEQKAAAIKDQRDINRAFAGFGNGEQLGSARDVMDRARNNDLDRIMADRRARLRREKEDADRAEAEAAAQAAIKAAEPPVATAPAAPPKLFMHEGLDLLANTGTPVHAAADGTVTAAGPNGGYGNWVRLQHDGHFATVYGHLSAFAYGVEKGATVRRGDIIGLVGSTGRSTGAHLHFELLVDARPVDVRNHLATRPAQLAGANLLHFNKQVAASLAQRDREAAQPELAVSIAKAPAAEIGRDAF